MVLNKAQEIIAYETEGPMLVIAGAGSGKTTALVNRTRTLLDKGVPASEILLITFTKKACKELELRLKNEIPAFTFHKLGLILMKKYIDRRIVPLDEEELEFIIDNICREIRVVYKSSYMYDMLNLKKKLGPKYIEKMDAFEPKDIIIQKIAMRYEKFKEEMFLADFDDLLFNLYKFARDGAKWKYVMLDEAQDSSELEFDIFNELCSSTNLTAVGDTSQAIYRFKGGRAENLLKFKEKFDARVVRMDINYRSLPDVVNAANSLIRHNGDEFYLEMKPYREGEADISFVSSDSPATEVMNIIKKSGHTDFFVLGRTWADVDFYHQKLYKNGFPIAKRTPVDVAMETHDMHNIFTLHENSENEYMLYWYLGFFIENSILDQIKGKIMDIYNTDSGAPIKVRSEIKKRIDSIKNCPPNKKSILTLLPGLRNAAISKRVFNIMGAPTLESYFTALYIVQSDIDESFKGVVLTTVHQVKGLQKKGVIIVNAVEDKFPLKPRVSDDKGQHYKDERNLFYVALTRAEDSLYIISPNKIKPYGKIIYTHESRFIKETFN